MEPSRQRRRRGRLHLLDGLCVFRPLHVPEILLLKS